MIFALNLARSDAAPSVGPNPRVGAIILDRKGQVAGEGCHLGAGTAHAEVVALADAGKRARGGTAVVTLEPCSHTGLTGPCTQALIDAGIARVVFAQTDPNPIAAGGAQVLRDAGIDVESGAYAEHARSINPAWSFAVERNRPRVTLKLASTLDGRVAAADGSSRWISGQSARAEVHGLRATTDAIAAGTGTVIADNPRLTDRRAGAARQPLRVIIGERDVPADAAIFSADAKTVHLRTRDLDEALSELSAMGVRSLLLEGGPTLATAFLKAGLVDELIWYVSPVLLGSEGRAAVQGLGIESIAGALRWKPTSTMRAGDDIRIDMLPAIDTDGES